MDKYTLTKDEKELIDGINAQVQRMSAQAEGALAMIAKQHGLVGELDYTDGVLRKKA